jgi:hypothetical protein
MVARVGPVRVISGLIGWGKLPKLCPTKLFEMALKPEYLKGVNRGIILEIGGWLCFRHHAQPGQHRFVMTYADGQAKKASVFSLLKAFGVNRLVPSEWDLHHIVEGRHFADLDFRGEYTTMYAQELPCILLHRQSEHSLYTVLAGIKATKELYLDKISGDSEARASQTCTLFSTIKGSRDDKWRGEQLDILRQRLANMRKLYGNTYSGDPLMRQIAKNVLDVAESKLQIL